MAHTCQSNRVIISVDYGTTYTGVSWILVGDRMPMRTDILVLKTWPGGEEEKVPSLYSYSSGGRWGFDVKNDEYVLRWSKLELRTKSRLEALTRLEDIIGEQRRNLQHESNDEIPSHLFKGTTDVIKDYLTNVARCLEEHITIRTFPDWLNTYPIDFIITHPAEWGYDECNSIFRCVNEAFGNYFPAASSRPGVMRMATEPEACAQLTMRYALDHGQNTLHVGDCVTVVDAGGGTVDLVSYLVMNLRPFRIKKLTAVSGSACGAHLIDKFFLEKFLPRRLSKNDMKTLQAGTGRAKKRGRGGHTVISPLMDILKNRFEDIKRRFAGPQPPGHPDAENWLDLVRGVGELDDESGFIRNRQLCITSYDLAEMFEESITKILDLIKRQMTELQIHSSHLRTIFLSGGYSNSPYLQNRVREMVPSGIYVSGGNAESWSAVAKGGVLLGLGLDCEQPPVSLPCPIHMGLIVAEDWVEYNHEEHQKYKNKLDEQTKAIHNIKWLVPQGNLIRSAEPQRMTQRIVKKFAPNESLKSRITLVFSQFDIKNAHSKLMRNDKPPTQIALVEHDLRRVDLAFRLESSQVTTVRKPVVASYRKADLELEVTVTQESANFQLFCGGQRSGQRSNASLLASHLELFHAV